MRVKVSGRVQGVMFRDSCRREAERQGVVGWVRNEPDGRVLLEAEGPDGAVDALVTWCRTGPPGAHVTGIDVREATPAGGSRFEVRW